MNHPKFTNLPLATQKKKSELTYVAMERETTNLPVCLREKGIYRRGGLSHEATHYSGRKTSHLFSLLEETFTLDLFRPVSAVTLMTFHMH